MFVCTIFIVAELVADHSGVSAVPCIITDSAPASMKAHLHSSLVVVPTSSEADISRGAVEGLIYYNVL